MNEQVVTTEILEPWPLPGVAVLHGRDGLLERVELTTSIFIRGNTADILDAEYIAEN